MTHPLQTSRHGSMTCTQCSLSRHGAPGPVGSGRRMAKSTGTTNLSSPTTTTNRTPSMPESTRCSCPLHQVPTSPNCSPYFLNIGHQGVGEAQVMEGLPQDPGSLLRLEAVTCEALVRCEVATLPGF